MRLRLQRVSHLTQHSLSRLSRISSMRNRPADYQVTRSVSQRIGRRRNPLLVANFGSRRPDTRNHQNRLRSGKLAHPCHFFRRANKPGDSRIESHPRKQLNLFARRAADADRCSLFGVHAGQNRNCQQLRRVSQLLKLIARRLKHGRST